MKIASESAKWTIWRLPQLLGTLLLGIALLSAVSLSISAAASAAVTLTNGQEYGQGVTALPTTPALTPGTPYDSGQNIKIVVPANNLFIPLQIVNIQECADPGGLAANLPTDNSNCDALTEQPNSVITKSDGSFVDPSYTIYSTPNSYDLGEQANSTPACNLANPCVLYIGQNQNDFTQPHLFSAPFSVSPDPTDSGIINPGDGTLHVSGSVSSSESTVAVTPVKAVANGTDLSTVTVTLLDKQQSPISGKTVTLQASPAATAVVTAFPPGATSSNNLGQVTFHVTDTIAENLSLSATDATDSLTLAQPAALTFEAPVASASNSSIVAASPSVPSLGASTTITVTVRDQGIANRPLANQTVQLQQTGTAAITPLSMPAGVTDASGDATFNVSADVPQSVVFSAKIVNADGLLITQTAPVTFGTVTLSVSAAKSAVTASASPAPIGTESSGTQVTVTLLTSDGVTPVSGKTVSLTGDSASAVVSPIASFVSDASGKVVFNVTDPTTETVHFAGTDVTDGPLVLTQVATVIFEGPSFSGTNSTVAASPAVLPADGTQPATVDVTIRDQFGQPIPGQTVELTAPGSSAQITPIQVGGAGTAGSTTAQGIAEFSAVDTTAETVTFAASDGAPVTGVPASVTFTAGSPDPNQSTITATPAQVPADGKTPATVSIFLGDHFQNPVGGKTVKLMAVNGSSVIAPSSHEATTDPAGNAVFTVTDATNEIVAYEASDVTDALGLTGQSVNVSFGTPPPPVPSATNSSISASTTLVPADGTSNGAILVRLFDVNGVPVPGKTVSLTTSGGSSVVAGLPATASISSPAAVARALNAHDTTAVSGSDGTASFSVTDRTAEAVSYTASDTTDNTNLAGKQVTITFTPAKSGPTTPTTTPGSTTATVAAGTAGSSGGGDSAGLTSTGSSGTPSVASDASSAGSLAFTGGPTSLPWMVGFGALLILVGSVGQRASRQAMRRRGVHAKRHVDG